MSELTTDGTPAVGEAGGVEPANQDKAVDSSSNTDGEGGDGGPEEETSAPFRTQTSGPGLRFARKRQVVIQNLDLSPLRLDDAPLQRHHHHAGNASSTTASGASKPSRVRLPPLTSIGGGGGSHAAGSGEASVLRSSRGGGGVTNDRMSTGPVDLAAA